MHTEIVYKLLLIEVQMIKGRDEAAIKKFTTRIFEEISKVGLPDYEMMEWIMASLLNFDEFSTMTKYFSELHSIAEAKAKQKTGASSTL